jgi:hypothetical protein
VAAPSDARLNKGLDVAASLEAAKAPLCHGRPGAVSLWFDDFGGSQEIIMRFIHLSHIGYFILALGVGLALWQTGVLGRVAPIWMGSGAAVAIGVGIRLSVFAGKPTPNKEVVKP